MEITQQVTILGPGIAGFIGGQLVDNAGITLPRLFQLSAAALFGWLFLCAFPYICFCKRYEKILFQQKENQLRAFEMTEDEAKLKSDGQTDEQKM